MGLALQLQVLKCSLALLILAVLNHYLIALGSIVRSEACTINEYIITVSVSEK